MKIIKKGIKKIMEKGKEIVDKTLSVLETGNNKIIAGILVIGAGVGIGGSLIISGVVQNALNAS